MVPAGAHGMRPCLPEQGACTGCTGNVCRSPVRVKSELSHGQTPGTITRWSCLVALLVRSVSAPTLDGKEVEMQDLLENELMCLVLMVLVIVLGLVLGGG